MNSGEEHVYHEERFVARTRGDGRLEGVGAWWDIHKTTLDMLCTACASRLSEWLCNFSPVTKAWSSLVMLYCFWIVYWTARCELVYQSSKTRDSCCSSLMLVIKLCLDYRTSIRKIRLVVVITSSQKSEMWWSFRSCSRTLGVIVVARRNYVFVDISIAALCYQLDSGLASKRTTSDLRPMVCELMFSGQIEISTLLSNSSQLWIWCFYSHSRQER